MLSSYPSRSFNARSVLAHDYLDDLESFFFVTTHLMYGWVGVEREAEIAPEFLELWDHENPTVSLNAKKLFILEPLDLEHVPSFWGLPCQVLLKSFHAFIRGIHSQKSSIRGPDPEERLKELDKLYTGFEDHYNTLKAIFDKALNELDQQQPITPASNCAPDNPPRAAKRGSDSVEESDEPENPSKRKRTTGGAKSRLAQPMDAHNETVRG